MATPPDDLARRILTSETGGATSPELVAAAVVSACERFASHLAPVIGEAGTRALLSRSLTLTTRRFAWLDSVPPSPTGRPCPELRLRMAAQSADAANEAAVAMLATLIGLLGKFIGGRLTRVLVHTAWPEVFPGRSAKETS